MRHPLHTYPVPHQIQRLASWGQTMDKVFLHPQRLLYVLEDLEYPWFAPKMQQFESGAVQDMCGEDVSFCLDAIEEGWDIWCDPRIRVGHEKTRII